MLPFPRILLNGYIIAVLATFLLAFVLYCLHPVFRGTSSLNLFLMGVVLATWYGGVRAGLLATVLSALANALLTEPFLSFQIIEARERLRLLLFVMVGAILSVVIWRLRQKEQWVLREMIRQKEQLEIEIASRVQAEMARRMSEDRLRMALEVGRAGAWSWDVANDSVEVSDSYLDLYGFPAGHPVTLGDWLAAVHPEDRERCYAHHEELLRTGEESKSEYRIFHPERGLRWINSIARAELDAHGCPIRVGGVNFDITENKRAEEALREKEHFLHRVTQIMPGVLNVVDLAERQAIFMNRSVASLIGFTSEEVQRMGNDMLPSLMHPEDLPRFEQYMARVGTLIDGEVADFEFRVRDRAGEWHWFRSHDTVFARDAAGVARQLIGVATEITGRKRAEESLRESEIRYRSLFESTGEGVVEVDMAGRIKHANLAYQKMLGYSLNELRELTYQQLTPPQWHEVETALVRDRILPLGDSAEYDKEYIHKDGHVFPVSLRVSLMRDANDEKVGMWAFVRDISERKRAENLLVASEEGLRLALEAGKMSAWDWNLESNEVLWNDEHYHLLGYEPGSFQPSYQKWKDRVHPEDIEVTEANFQRCIKEGSEYSAVYRVLTTDGSLRWIEAHGRFVLNVDGHAIRSLGILQNITERKLTEQALREADHRKNEFLAMLGHELRNPLTPISTAAEILSAPELNQTTLARVSKVLGRNVSHMTRLVDDLLDVSRITRGHIKVELKPVNLNEILLDCAETFEPLFQSKHHAFNLQLPDRPVIIQGDRIRLTQVFGNLLNNASKYTQDGGYIELKAILESTAIQVDVIDNGMGLAPQLLPQVFDLFTQGERTLARSEGGLGIGLTLVKKLVELHSGTIEAFSEGIDRGARFTIHLPLDEQAIVTGTTPPSMPITPTLEPLRVLIIDDNWVVAEGLAMFFEMQNTNVQIVLNGQEGINETEQFKPDIVILDIGMPDMDGFEVARRLRALPISHSMKLIALSGYAENKDDPRYAAAGFDIYLNKPANLARLNALLDELKRQRKNTQ